MNVKVLGMGCLKCKTLERLVREAAVERGLAVTVDKVTDVHEIMRYGVLNTPGLVVEGVVKSTGRVPAKTEIGGWLQEALAGAAR